MSQKREPNRTLLWIQKAYPKSAFQARALVEGLGVSRQTASRELKKLILAGQLQKTGSTKSAQYRLGKSQERAPELRKLISLRGQKEDRVFDEILRSWPGSRLPENAARVFGYAFTEMLNNAIDHSKSPKAEIRVRAENGVLFFSIRDFGIGIFRNIAKRLGLKREEDAVELLLAGKQTTAPEAHSGQGIFFTSKIADRFSLRAGRLELSFDNEGEKDVRLKAARPIKGTEVRFSLKSASRKTLKDLFERYANDDFEFDRTSYPVVVLAQTGSISRSQAKRLAASFDEFERAILDFKNVKEMGQGFADELFRIYQSRRPRFVLETRNANSAVHFMIERSKAR